MSNSSKYTKPERKQWAQMAALDGVASVAQKAGVADSTVYNWMDEFNIKPSSENDVPTLGELGLTAEDLGLSGDLFGADTPVISIQHEESSFRPSWLDDPDLAGREVGDINPIPAGIEGFEINNEKFTTVGVCLTRSTAMAVSRRPEMLMWFSEIFQRHQQGDWGDLKYEEDVETNELGLTYGDRLMSSYDIPEEFQDTPGLLDLNVWLITDGGPSKDRMGRTTILFPMDY